MFFVSGLYIALLLSSIFLNYISIARNSSCYYTYFFYARFLYLRILLFRHALVHFAKNSSLRIRTSSTTLQLYLAIGCVEVYASTVQELPETIQPNIETGFVPLAWYTILCK